MINKFVYTKQVLRWEKAFPIDLPFCGSRRKMRQAGESESTQLYILPYSEAVSREIVRKYLEEISRHPQPEPSVFETSERKKVIVRKLACPPVDNYDPKYFLRCHSAYEKKTDKVMIRWMRQETS